MSKHQRQPVATTATEEQTSEPDDREPTPERQGELRASRERNEAAGTPPYSHVQIRTRGELRWVMQDHSWFGGVLIPHEGDLTDSELALILHTERANLREVDLSRVDLSGAELVEADLTGANLDGCKLTHAYLISAKLAGAKMLGCVLSGADMRDADLSGARLQGAHLTGTWLNNCTLKGTLLNRVTLDALTVLDGAALDTHTQLADVVWNGVPLTRVDWQRVPKLGDESAAEAVERQYKATLLGLYQDAARANHQLAVALRSQGLNEYADHFAYRAQRLQRKVTWKQALLRAQDVKPWTWPKPIPLSLWGRTRRLVAYAFSLLLDLISGYGYKPGRSVLTYLLVVGGFAAAYFFLGPTVHPPLSVHDAIVFSILSFHGRGFAPSESITLHDPVTTLTAVEAIIGLLIEITFIATFTQRFFAR